VSISMGKFVGISVALFVLAVLFVGLTQGAAMAAIFAAFGALPWLQKIAWAVIVLVPLVMLPFAVWLWDRLVRQRQRGHQSPDRGRSRRAAIDAQRSRGRHRRIAAARQRSGTVCANSAEPQRHHR